MKQLSLAILLAALAIACAVPAIAQTVTATNRTPGHQTIAFAIPQNIWIMQWLHPGKCVLYSSIGYCWHADFGVLGMH